MKDLGTIGCLVLIACVIGCWVLLAIASGVAWALHNPLGTLLDAALVGGFAFGWYIRGQETRRG